MQNASVVHRTALRASSLTRNFAYSARLFVGDYLFRAGGAYSIAICRIALFGYLLIHVFADIIYIGVGSPDYYQGINLSSYHAKSLVYLFFPSAPPPVELLQALVWLAGLSTLAAIAGLATRWSMIASTVSLTFLSAIIWAWQPLWSHPYNSGLLAAWAFMFGRAGDVWSVDSWIARSFLRSPISLERRVYWWPVILGQFGVSAVYFGGFYAKWSTPDFAFDLSWALSDNLRNSVSLPWLIRGEPLPWNVDLLVNTPWLWKLAALGHLATQALPILALASLNRPWLRLAEGLVFAAGVVLLKLIMGMWNPQWLILTAFFVDWEYFLRRAGVSLSASGTRPVERPWLPAAYATAFVLANLIIIVVRYDDRGSSRLYPLSSMNFYSNVAAAKPYSEHLFYPRILDELILRYPGGSERKWYCYPTPQAPAIGGLALAAYENVPGVEKIKRQVGAMEGIVGAVRSMGTRPSPPVDCVGTVDVSSYEAIDLFASVLRIPAYPSPVSFQVGFRGLVSRYEKDGDRTIAAAAGVSAADGTMKVSVATAGLQVRRIDLLLANDPWKNENVGPLLDLPGSWDESTYLVDEAFFKSLRQGWYPVVVRVTEDNDRTYDFFSGILYR